MIQRVSADITFTQNEQFGARVIDGVSDLVAEVQKHRGQTNMAKAGNPGAPAAYEYRWTNDRWETSGEYPYFCDRNDPGSAVQAQRSDYWIPNADGSFSGMRTLVIDGVGCPGEGPGTHAVPISMVPIEPPPHR